MRVLVTGAAGFLGSHLVDRLLADGHDVTGLDDLSDGRWDNLAAARRARGLSFSRFDVTDPALTALVAHARPEAICHLAGRSGGATRDRLTVDVVGTQVVLDAARRAGTGRVLIASSAAVYPGERGAAVTERAGVRPGDDAGAGKAAAEVLLRLFRGRDGLDCSALVLGAVYGPRRVRGVVTGFAESLLAGTATVIRGDGSATQDYVYVEDAVDAFARALIHPGRLPRRLHVGSGRPVAVREVHRLIAEATGRPDAPGFAAPGPADGPLAALESSLARRRLGWEPFTPLSAGVALTVRWLRGRARQ